MLPCLTLAGRATLIVGLVGLALAGCGRRGALEPPPDPTVRTAPSAPGEGRRAGGAPPAQITLQSQGAVPGADPGVEEEEANPLPSALPTPPARRRRQGYTIPKEPFLLDPLL